MRNVLCGARHHDNIEAFFHFRPAEISIADLGVDVPVSDGLDRFADGIAERFDDFDAIHLFADARKDGCLVAASGANFERHLARFRLRQLCHVRLAQVVA